MVGGALGLTVLTGRHDFLPAVGMESASVRAHERHVKTWNRTKVPVTASSAQRGFGAQSLSRHVTSVDVVDGIVVRLAACSSLI